MRREKRRGGGGERKGRRKRKRGKAGGRGKPLTMLKTETSLLSLSLLIFLSHHLPAPKMAWHWHGMLHALPFSSFIPNTFLSLNLPFSLLSSPLSLGLVSGRKEEVLCRAEHTGDLGRDRDGGGGKAWPGDSMALWCIGDSGKLDGLEAGGGWWSGKAGLGGVGGMSSLALHGCSLSPYISSPLLFICGARHCKNKHGHPSSSPPPPSVVTSDRQAGKKGILPGPSHWQHCVAAWCAAAILTAGKKR